MFWHKLMAPEADDGSGGADEEEVDTEVEAPDDSEAARAAAEEAANKANGGSSGSGNPPPPQAASPDTTNQQIAQLLEQNRQLAMQLAAQGRGRPDPEDDEKLDPDVERIINRRISKAQAGTQGMVAQLADQLDQQNFTQAIKEYGYDQPTVDEAKKVFTNWRRAGISATREDALMYVVGRADAQARKAKGGGGTRVAAPKPPNPHANLERQGGKGAAVSKGGGKAPAVALDDTPRNAAERREWIKKFEAAQDKAGPF
jgi:hypothetical protein